MPWLPDTGILLRAAHRPDPLQPAAWGAVRILRLRGEVLCYTLQTLAEFWNVCTRPVTARGGFGLAVAETDRRVRVIERSMTFLPDTPAVRDQWRQLVASRAIAGVQVHDARLVAAMLAHGVTHLLTFNVADFRRYPEIMAVHPQDVVDGNA
jgi:predicted nucleic acid-binding protein